MKFKSLLFLSLFMSPSFACTDFKLTSKDGTVVIARSLEFGQDLQSNLRSSTRERSFNFKLDNNKAGLNWKGKYGYLYIDGFQVDAAFDGLNEKGLSFEYLYLPGETEYQTVPQGKESQAVPYFHFGDWVLSNFQSIDEVKTALKNIYVTQAMLPGLGNMVLPAHAAIYEQSGKGIVVEFYNNQINVSESIGTMTNSPRYEWHVTNLRNYINLSALNAQPVTQGKFVFNSTGQGSGAVGLPGDASPPSRFVKTAFMQKNVYQAKDPVELLNLAEHIINNVDLPAGYVRGETNGQTETDTTQWVVFKDLTHLHLAYRTYGNLTLRHIHLDRINFAKDAPLLKMPLAIPAQPLDYTENFLKSADKS